MPSLINMQNSAEEAAEQFGVPDPKDGPKYPWGLQITLNEDSLEKLGVTAMPATGTEVTLIAKATVTGTSERQTAGEGTRSSMDLQITDLQLDGLDKDVFGRAAAMLYGKAKS